MLVSVLGDRNEGQNFRMDSSILTRVKGDTKMTSMVEIHLTNKSNMLSKARKLIKLYIYLIRSFQE